MDERTDPDATPVCPGCLAPIDPSRHYCKVCGRDTGQFTTYIPYVDIPWMATGFGAVWHKLCHETRPRWYTKVGYFLFIGLFAPVMLVALPFVWLNRRKRAASQRMCQARKPAHAAAEPRPTQPREPKPSRGTRLSGRSVLQAGLPMRFLRYVEAAVLWALATYLLWWVGTMFGVLLLRSAEMRSVHAPPDWLDAAVGILVVLLVAGFFLVVRLRVASMKQAAQHGAAAGERAQAGARR